MDSKKKKYSIKLSSPSSLFQAGVFKDKDYSDAMGKAIFSYMEYILE